MAVASRSSGGHTNRFVEYDGGATRDSGGGIGIERHYQRITTDRITPDVGCQRFEASKNSLPHVVSTGRGRLNRSPGPSRKGIYTGDCAGSPRHEPDHRGAGATGDSCGDRRAGGTGVTGPSPRMSF